MTDDLAARLGEARALVGMLRARGDDVHAARMVTFELLVPGPEVDPALLDHARLEGFSVVGARVPRLAARLGLRARAVLRLQRVTAVDEAAAEAFTRCLVVLADQHGGRFEQWLPEPVGQGREPRAR